MYSHANTIYKRCERIQQLVNSIRRLWEWANPPADTFAEIEFRYCFRCAAQIHLPLALLKN